MTLKIALLLISLPLLALGGHGLYHVAHNRTQTTVTCEQFARERPPALWLRVTGCELDYVGAGYREARGKIAELYFPVRLPKADRSAPVRLVAVTTDPQALAIAQETIGDARQPEQEAFLVMMLRIVTTLRASREVDGAVRNSPLSVPSTRRALSGMGAALAPDVAVMDLHTRPAFLRPAIEAATGLMALLVFVLLVLPRRAAPAPAKRLPALLLLNLPEGATTADIEKAPALGRRKEVKKKIKTAVRGIGFSKNRGTLERPDVSLTIDLGEADVVLTAVVNASGDGAPEAIRALARATGWRIFIPRHGVFAK